MADVRAYYNESGDTWVMVIDPMRAFVARREPVIHNKPQWILSARKWVTLSDGTQELKIVQMGRFDTIEEAQQAINVDAPKKTFSYSSSKDSSSNTSEILSLDSL